MPKRSRPALVPAPPAAEPEPRHFTCFHRPTFSHTLLDEVQKGSADAQFELGRQYFEGRPDASSATHYGKDGRDVVASFVPGVPRDPAAAADLLCKAARQGHAEAQKLLEVVKLHTSDDVH